MNDRDYEDSLLDVYCDGMSEQDCLSELDNQYGDRATSRYDTLEDSTPRHED